MVVTEYEYCVIVRNGWPGSLQDYVVYVELLSPRRI